MLRLGSETLHCSARHLCTVVNDTKFFSCSRSGREGTVEYGPRKSMDIGFTAQKLLVLPSNIRALPLKSYVELYGSAMKPSRRAMTFICVIDQRICEKE